MKTHRQTRYVIVTPVRDEAATLSLTIRSVAGQSVLPVEWVIVNDGSSDGTAGIIDAAAAEYPWIHAVHRRNRGCRLPGGGVVEAFNDGLAQLRRDDWDFIVKLDGDLSFDCRYFEECFGRFDQDPSLGIGGGLICNSIGGELRVESCPWFHVRGATKIYRNACWKALGGFWPSAGWDTIDEMKAQRLGWRTRSFNDLHVVHHRPTGAADGFWAALVKYGRANYIAGYHPLFMVCKCIKRLFQPPCIVGSFALFYGFLSSYAKRVPQVDDPATIAYIRGQQLSCLRGGRSIWR
jgi:glycosyltransferase involved in cell wall biosynthesis